MKALLVVFIILSTQVTYGETPIVVYDYDGEFILSNDVEEEIKVTYVGGALAMLREIGAKSVTDIKLGEDDWDNYLKIAHCYKENPKLVKAKVVRIISRGCR